MTFAKMRAFALKFCQGIYIFQFIDNLWLQYSSQAYQMNCVKLLAHEMHTKQSSAAARGFVPPKKELKNAY